MRENLTSSAHLANCFVKWVSGCRLYIFRCRPSDFKEGFMPESLLTPFLGPKLAGLTPILFCILNNQSVIKIDSSLYTDVTRTQWRRGSSHLFCKSSQRRTEHPDPDKLATITGTVSFIFSVNTQYADEPKPTPQTISLGQIAYLFSEFPQKLTNQIWTFPTFPFLKNLTTQKFYFYVNMVSAFNLIPKMMKSCKIVWVS